MSVPLSGGRTVLGQATHASGAQQAGGHRRPPQGSLGNLVESELEEILAAGSRFVPAASPPPPQPQQKKSARYIVTGGRDPHHTDDSSVDNALLSADEDDDEDDEDGSSPPRPVINAKVSTIASQSSAAHMLAMHAATKGPSATPGHYAHASMSILSSPLLAGGGSGNFEAASSTLNSPHAPAAVSIRVGASSPTGMNSPSQSMSPRVGHEMDSDISAILHAQTHHIPAGAGTQQLLHTPAASARGTGSMAQGPTSSGSFSAHRGRHGSGLMVQTHHSSASMPSFGVAAAANAPGSAQNHTPTHQNRPRHRNGQLSWGGGSLVGQFSPMVADDDQRVPLSAGRPARAESPASPDSARPTTSRVHVVRVKDAPRESIIMTPALKGGTAAIPAAVAASSAGGGSKFNSFGKAKHRAQDNYKMKHDPFYKNQHAILKQAALTSAPAIAAPDPEDVLPKRTPLGPTAWHAAIDIPLYKADGELDPGYLARRALYRQRVALRSFVLFALGYLLMGVPYVLYLLADQQRALSEGGLWPLIIRAVATAVMLLAAVGMAIAHRRDARGYAAHVLAGSGPLGASALGPFRFFDTDRYCGLLTVAAALALLLMESFRWRPFLESNLLLQDLLLLQLTLVYAFLFSMLRLNRVQVWASGVTILVAYNLAFLFLLPALSPSWSSDDADAAAAAVGAAGVSHTLTVNYMLKCDAFQLLLIVSLGIYHQQITEFLRRDGDKKKALHLERRKAERLLKSMLPGSVYTTVLQGKNPYLSGIATIGFCNVELTYEEGFKPLPTDLMQRLHDTFKRIDGIVDIYKQRGINKIETVSKTYLLCAGLLEDVEDHAAAIVDVCLEIMHMIEGRAKAGGGKDGAGTAAGKPGTASAKPGTSGGVVTVGEKGKSASKISCGLKIGIATGPVVGGIIGTQRRFFRVFGDTVNVSARMCTNCTSGFQIQMSSRAYESLNEIQRSQYCFPLEGQRSLQIKGKGSMDCFLVQRRDDWIPRFGKALMNRGREGADDDDSAGATSTTVAETAAGKVAPSFVFHKIVAATTLRPFPLLYYNSTYAHHDPALLANEGPSSSTSAHLEFRLQIAQFNHWRRLTLVNVVWIFAWLLACFGVVFWQRANDDPREFDTHRAIKNRPVFDSQFTVLCGSILAMTGAHFSLSLLLSRNNRFKKYAQRFTALYAVGISAWILAILYFWGLNAGPIAPHFAYILLNLYIDLYMHLQLRFVLPIMIVDLLGFVAVMLVQRVDLFDMVAVLLALSLITAALCYGSYRGENRIRSNYLVQYALDMEQTQVDAFLKNLLPQFVVNVLKKQAIGGDNKKAEAAGTAQKRGSIGDATSELTGSMTSRDGGVSSSGSSASHSHVHVRRRSVFDASNNLSLGNSGLSSRFAMHFPNATVFESDIVGYTKLVSNWPAQRTLHMLNELFSMFDAVATACEVEKIETIGDAFMAVVFEDEPDSALDFALAVIEGLREMNAARAGEAPIEVRAGVCTGPAFGGVIGSDVPRFHLFGPAHDGSILLEQNGLAMTAMVSAPTFHQSCTRYRFEKRPEISCEGLAEQGVWQLMGAASNHVSALQRRRTMTHTTTTATPTAKTAVAAGLSSNEVALRIANKAARSAALSPVGSAAVSAATSAATTPVSKNGPKQGAWV